MADPDARAVHTIDADALTELAVTPLDGEPAQILPLADGRVLISLRDTNRLAVFEIPAASEAPLEPRCSVATHAEPWGLAASPDGATVALTAAWAHRLTLLASADLAPLTTVDLPPEPRGVLLSADGRAAWVNHMTGGRVSKILLDGAPRVTTINPRPEEPAPKPEPDTKNKKNQKPQEPQKPRADPSTTVQGFAIAEASINPNAAHGPQSPARIFAPMAGVDPGQFEAFMGLPSSYGGSQGFSVVHVPYVAVLDPTRDRPMGRPLRPGHHIPSFACGLPRAAVVSGDQLYVACMGIDRLLQLDARSIEPDHTLLRSFEIAPGPSGVAVDARNQRALVASQFGPVLSVVDLAPDANATSRRLELARPSSPPLSAELARGRALFHVTNDSRISQDGRACASCHPDGRTDGLTWITPDGPRQTISLAGRSTRKSGPFGWFGDHPSLRDHLSFTVKRLGGTGFKESDPKDKADLAALIAWLEVMPAPVREGALADDESQTRERGRELFYAAETGCSTCHIAGDTDRRRHNVGSGQVIEKSLAFDTPSLRFIGGTAPYFHDGRYPTLFAMVSDPRSKMGHSAGLPEADRRALAAFLETL